MRDAAHMSRVTKILPFVKLLRQSEMTCYFSGKNCLKTFS